MEDDGFLRATATKNLSVGNEEMEHRDTDSPHSGRASASLCICILVFKKLKNLKK